MSQTGYALSKAEDPTGHNSGRCLTNINGQCLTGGTTYSTTGTTSYSSGECGEMCIGGGSGTAYFAAGGQYYHPNGGWVVSSNSANPVKMGVNSPKI